MKKKLIIVGGGISGLVAANELAKHFEILIIEGSNRIGGRIHTTHPPGFSRYIEAGAEFIHGHCIETLQLLKNAGITYEPVQGKFYRKEKGNWNEQFEMIEGWDELLKKMGKLKTDMTLINFLDEYYDEQEYMDLRKHAMAYTEGFDVADPQKVSVQSLYKEWSAEEEENFRINGGYGILVEFLQEKCIKHGCVIELSDPVRKIDWKPNEVEISTVSGKQYKAHMAIITVPVSVLQRPGSKNSIEFHPGIDEYIEASRQIGMGAVIKVVLEFDSCFWKMDTGFIISDAIIPTWWTQLPEKTPILTGWAGGPGAERLAQYSDKELLEKAIESLALIFNQAPADIQARIKAGFVANWQQNNWSNGAYSYSTPPTKEAKQLLNTPLENTLFFAGEGLYEGKSPGTVEAAIASAKQVANKVLKFT
jgi:monoamine oxidase